MIVSEVMSRFPVIVSPELSCARALAISEDQMAHFLLAVSGDELLGVLRACDLRKSSPSARVAGVMRAPVMPIARTDSVLLAERILTVGGAGCLVVVDDTSCLEGILTREDLSRAGLLMGERGIDCCAACGAVQHVIFAGADRPALCCACLDVAAASDVSEKSELTSDHFG